MFADCPWPSLLVAQMWLLGAHLGVARRFSAGGRHYKSESFRQLKSPYLFAMWLLGHLVPSCVWAPGSHKPNFLVPLMILKLSSGSLCVSQISFLSLVFN